MLKKLFSFILLTTIVVNSSEVLKSRDEHCQLCTHVLQTAQTLLGQNRTEASIIKLIKDDVCTRLGSLSNACLQYVEAYGSVALEELAQKIVPSNICKRVGICGAKLDKLPHPEDIRTVTQNSKSGTVCQICTVVMSAAQNLLEQNKTEDEILNFIEKNLCSRLGSLGQICDEYVSAYGKIILYELAQKIDPSVICNHLGLCETKNIPPNPKLKKMSNSLNCTLCKLVFQQVVDLLKNNASETQIIGIIETKLCNATGKMSELCKELVDAYGPAILKYLADGVNPEKVCELIGMCSANKKINPIKKRLIDQPKSNNEIFCYVCQYALAFIDHELQNNKTEQAIISTLDLVCKLAPQSLKQQCDSLINTYGVYLVQLLEQFADPQKVCEAIKLCV
ncbi:proactivator polypeptide-like [Brachionus plicatilis]|uniref:Proactivator polypeptide-like n=1 Tax=Brachionus plicatilis TaxID=10195 RepID=A0A3M7QCJ8_BRAPC|nr:proactivator polypeptide-like [Brachionus plicatilis]